MWCINNHTKCKCTEFTNKKAQSSRLEQKNKTKPYTAFKRHISAARTNVDSKWKGQKWYSKQIAYREKRVLHTYIWWNRLQDKKKRWWETIMDTL